MVEFAGSGLRMRIADTNKLLVIQLIGNLSIYKGNATTTTNYFKYIVISNLVVYDVKILDLPFKTKPRPRLNYKFSFLFIDLIVLIAVVVGLPFRGFELQHNIYKLGILYHVIIWYSTFVKKKPQCRSHSKNVAKLQLI